MDQVDRAKFALHAHRREFLETGPIDEVRRDETRRDADAITRVLRIAPQPLSRTTPTRSSQTRSLNAPPFRRLTSTTGSSDTHPKEVEWSTIPPPDSTLLLGTHSTISAIEGCLLSSGLAKSYGSYTTRAPNSPKMISNKFDSTKMMVLRGISISTDSKSPHRISFSLSFLKPLKNLATLPIPSFFFRHLVFVLHFRSGTWRI